MSDGFHFFNKRWELWDVETSPWYLKSVWEHFYHNRFILGNVCDLELNRCQVNLTTKTLFADAHVDGQPDNPSYTMVHFVNGDSGMRFWSGDYENRGNIIKEVEYKDNTAVFFPANMLHQGLPPKDVEPRISVGYTFSGKGTVLTRQNRLFFPIFEDQYKEQLKRIML